MEITGRGVRALISVGLLIAGICLILAERFGYISGVTTLGIIFIVIWFLDAFLVDMILGGRE